MSVLAATDVLVQSQDIEGCHRSGKPDRDKSKKTIVRFVNRTNYKKVLFNNKKLSSIDNSKHSFTLNTKIFANENLTPMNESIAYNCIKLKWNGLTHGCFSRDGIVRIKRREKR